MQIVLGIVLLIVAILVFNFDPGAKQSGGSDETSDPASSPTATRSGDSPEDSEGPPRTGKAEAGRTDTPSDSDSAAGTNDEFPSETTGASTTENQQLTEELPESTDE